MRHLIVICSLFVLLAGVSVQAQIPRANSGQFEYTGEIIAENMPRVMEKARRFFNQPFLVHWDSIAREEQPENLQVTGTGHITVKAKQHGLSMPSPIPVSLCMKIEIRNGHYRYTINHFVVNNKNGGTQFPLEDKPDSVKSIVYDQLIQNTHKRVSFMIGWLKKYMKDEE